MNKPFYIIIFLLLFCCEAKTQINLIYNGDFEMYSGCPLGPSDPSQIPNYEITKCLGWTAPTYGTSDYFNRCSLSPFVGVPTNGLGIQQPYNGNGYCGFLALSFNGQGPCYFGDYWFEYIQGQFTQNLIAGHTYNIGFYFSLADNCGSAVKDLGIFISTTAVGNTCSSGPLTYTPQITNVSNTYLTDTANWFLISGTYKALGGEKYLTIGNFADTLHLDTISVNGGGESYYYVDAGYTYDITDIGFCKDDAVVPNVFTPNADGINDIMQISDTCFKVNSMSIYNRLGNLIIDSKTISFWDGRITSGEACSDGIYYYMIETENKKGETKTQKGFVQLIR